MRSLKEPRTSGERDISSSRHVFIAQSRAMEPVLRQISIVAENPYPVVIHGATGTGKEVAARAIHEASRRAHGPFIVVDCPAIPGELLESELFGYEAGSFTGGQKARPGIFELAKGGTLVLDEIGDMSQQMQVKLLRTLETGFLRRIGDRKEIPLDARIIVLTQCPLEELVTQGKFRPDLRHRLDVFSIGIPLLRDRPEDIVPLFEYFAKEDALRAKPLSRDACTLLLRYSWPGNVRELRNAARRALWTSAGEFFIPADFGLPDTGHIVPLQEPKSRRQWQPLKHVLGESRYAVDAYILEALDACDGNIRRTAVLLGTTREALSARINIIRRQRRPPS